MPAAARKGDQDDGSGSVSNETAATVFINGIAAAVVGSSNQNHDDDHDSSSISQGSSTVFIEGKAAARKGDQYECGHIIIEGSDNVDIGG
jgi:hypothetical protein